MHLANKKVTIINEVIDIVVTVVVSGLLHLEEYMFSLDYRLGLVTVRMNHSQSFLKYAPVGLCL